MRFPRSWEFVDQRKHPLLFKERPHACIKRVLRKSLWLEFLEEVVEVHRSPALDRRKWLVTDAWGPQLWQAGLMLQLLFPLKCAKL